HRFYTQTLDALALHNHRPLTPHPSPPRGEGSRSAPSPSRGEGSHSSPLAPEGRGVGGEGTPRFQAMFCIGEREESIRRHIEELAPDAETFGIPGFYFIDMYYRGAGDAHFVALCPAVMQPRHWVVEKVVERLEDVHQRRAWTRRLLGRATHQLHVGSRGFA